MMAVIPHIIDSYNRILRIGNYAFVACLVDRVGPGESELISLLEEPESRLFPNTL